MGCGQCIEGHNERETLELSLRWMSGWAIHLAKDVMAISKALNRIGTGNGLNNNYGYKSKEELCACIAASDALIYGLAHSLKESYTQSGDGTSVLPNILRDFEDIEEKCKGEKPFGTTWIDTSVHRQIRKCIGDEEDPEYAIIQVDGNKDFLRRQHYRHTLLEYLNKVIDLDAVIISGKSKVALLFDSFDALDFVMKECNDVLAEINKTYGGDVRFFCQSNEIVEKTLEDSCKNKVGEYEEKSTPGGDTKELSKASFIAKGCVTGKGKNQ